MRYLIVGGTSIFGEGLVDRLLAKNDTEVIIATHLPGEKIFLRDRLVWEELDLRNEMDTNRVVKEAKASIIFDLAAQDSVDYAWKNPTETVNINVVGTINLLNAVRDYSNYSRLIIGGSGEEYGRVAFSSLPVNETTNLKPNNIFGATKACQTMFAKLYQKAYNLDIIVLRILNVTSVRQNEKFAVSSFCKQFVEIESGRRPNIIQTGNLANIRDFTDVDDLIRAIEIVGEKGKSGEIYNVAKGQPTSLLDIIRILEKLTGIKVEIHRNTNRIRPMDSPAIIADVNKIYTDTGWKAEIPLEVTIESLLNSWREKLNV